MVVDKSETCRLNRPFPLKIFEKIVSKIKQFGATKSEKNRILPLQSHLIEKDIWTIYNYT